MKTFRAEVASTASYELAEGPVWDADRERLLWVDIPRGRVLCGRLRPGGVEVSEEHRFAGTVGEPLCRPPMGGCWLRAAEGSASSILTGRGERDARC